jgi:hypothetical protein
MSETEAIYYLRQELEPLSQAQTFRGASLMRIDAHFYVKTDDGLNAGAVAAGFCSANGFECAEYSVLPQLLERTQIADHETEHLEAWRLAGTKGFAVVIALVASW